MATYKNMLVPVQLTALVVNQSVRKFQNFRRFRYNFQNMGTFTSVEPEPFGGGITDFAQHDSNQGIYLHWKLPAALRHGTRQDPNSDIEFPLVPNRWLVVRYAGPVTQRVATAWVVESDFLGDPGGSNSYLDYRIPFDPEKPLAAKTLIGRSLSLNKPDQWKETNTKALFLTATGPGDVLFSAYEPIADNVFAFQDTLDGIATDNLSYFVAGWYSDASKDILSGWKTADDFTDLLSSLNWQVGNGVDAAATGSLYHGMVFGIPWDVNGLNPGSAHDPSGVVVSIGNTAADALTALIAKQQPEHPEGGTIDPLIIEAFQYDLLHYLEERNGQERLDQRIHEAWFGSLPGGVEWEVVENPDNDAVVKLDAPYFTREAAALAQLNTDQLAYEQALFTLQRMQADLFANWWKYYRAKTMYFPPSNVPKPADIFKLIDSNNAGSLYNQVQQQLNVVAAAQRKLPQITATDTKTVMAQIAAFAQGKGIDKSRQLKRGEARRYWQAADPVILINGANYHPPALTNDTLMVRTPDQLVKGMLYHTKPDDAGKSISLSQLAAVLPKLDLTNLPVGIQDLLNEFFLLDPTNATAMAKAALNTADAAIIANLTTQIKTYSQTTDLVPAIIPGDWKQPWEPLFMEWKVDWYPIPYRQQDYLWSFDGNDYAWNGKGTVTSTPYSISGRTFLTPQITYAFKSKLEKFLTDFPQDDLTALKDFITKVDQWDFISQTLTGFTAQLRKVSPLSNVAPTGGVAQLVQDAYGPVPSPSSAIPFDGVRSGQFVIKQLKLFDAFGQALEIVEDIPGSGPTASDNYRPVIAEGLTPVNFVSSKNTFRFIQLLPRLLQPARLNFDFLDTKSNDHKINTTAGANPVCAWLLPNHIDQGLMAYTPAGNALGELRVTVNEQNTPVLNFWPSPNSPVAVIADMMADYPHLGYMFQSLVNQGPDVFRDFMQVIDSTLWTTDPLGSRHDEYFSVLIGRPLALVRTALQFELYGGPLRDPSWEKTFDTSTPAFVNNNFSIKLGNQALRNDGLIGYYVGSDQAAYNTFNTVHIPGEGEDPVNDAGTYIQPIAPGNFLQLDLTGNKPAYLSLLVDPRAAVHAVTGILPITTLSLPDRFLTDALTVMEITFRTGPILTELSGADLKTVNYVPPAENRQNWSWIEKSNNADELKGYDTYSLQGVDQSAKLSTIQPALRDGWLQLKQVEDTDSQGA